MISWLIILAIFVALWELLFVIGSFLFANEQEDFVAIKFFSFFLSFFMLMILGILRQIFASLEITNFMEVFLRTSGISIIICLFIFINWCIFQLIDNFKNKPVQRIKASRRRLEKNE